MTHDTEVTDRSLLDALRHATLPRHQDLERDLSLLSPRLSRRRMRTLLERFYGFFAVWEPAVALALDDRDFFGKRRKLPLLQANLQLLGLTEDAVAALPRCAAAADLAQGPDRAMGSAYVLEGATLGGKIISRHLAGLPWKPARHLSFFDPYGAETGAMWMAFCIRAAAQSRPERDPIIVAAAVETFQTIHRWLQPAFIAPYNRHVTT